MERKITAVASFMGMTAIILGAFGAHALKKHLSVEQLTSFETGVKYQMYHALFLLYLGMNALINEKTRVLLFRLVVIGVILFSGSIYLLATKPVSGIDFKSIGFLTPIGGALLIVSWGILLLHFLKTKR
ncbi:MAG: DUF423 domain-containing protein [Flavobacterium sp.]